ncbi:permease-like cell division protein FtsX [Thermoflavimicrobium daqui]|jgi:cell division transport system permease protein|uniref:Cell division protein FtsX n=1 Tax=Thermoflavimicrobium daqui TaxID=2137476 RepID=A0A364K5A3_9BACL|nr:permease-like cell division protein FtsX [Thermoflavimicrobium daqui]RAL24526.1 cell division protein FtsX [Thermoflavimicrobium daqui]
MKIDTFFRHIREASRGIRKNSWMSFAAIGAVAVTLFIFGFFLIFTFNISYLTKELDKQVAIRVSLRDGLTADEQEKLLENIQKDPMVSKANLVPKEQGIRDLKQQWGKDSDFLDQLQDGDENPLPDMIHVIPKNPEQIKQLEAQLEKNSSQVEHADSGGNVTDRILRFSTFMRTVVLVFSLALAILAAFLISNTIKLTIIARRREIEVMRLVGASNWFIRWPFFIEGAFIGMIGSIVPIGVSIGVYYFFHQILSDGETYGLFKMMPVLDLSTRLGITTLLMGIFIGSLGSMISVRRFLKI